MASTVTHLAVPRDKKPGKEWLTALGLAIVLLPILALLGYSVIQHRQQLHFDEEVKQASLSLSGRISEMSTLMASLSSMYRVSDTANSSDLLMFAENLRDQTGLIAMVGRYEYVTNAWRTGFEQQMSETGLYNFRINEIDSDGRPRESLYKEDYYPISMLEPMQPTNLKMIGADLSQLPGFNKRLTSAMRSGKQVLFQLPPTWTMLDNLTLFSPLYKSNQPPENEDQRLRQAAGGLWISFSIEALTDTLIQNRPDLELTLTLHDDLSSSILRHQPATAEKGFLSEWFPDLQHSMFLEVGQSRIEMSARANPGCPPELFWSLLGALMVILSTLGLGAEFSRGKRLARQQKRKAELDIEQERVRAARTLDSIDDAVISLNEEYKIVHANQSALHFLRADAPLHARDLLSVLKLHKLDGQPLDLATAVSAAAETMLFECEVRRIPEDEDQRIFLLSISAPQDGDQSERILVLRDVTEAHELTEALRYQADHDPLTGCTNRSYFENHLRELIETLTPESTGHSICYLDLDQFKVINDTCGHIAGDRLLVELTRNLSALLGHDGTLSRLGGDEFGVIFEHCEPREAERKANELHSFFQNYIFHVGERAFPVRASIGMVHIDEHSGSMGELLAAVDLACYASKDAGRNYLYVYNNDDVAISERSNELHWLSELQRALQEDAFELYAQAVCRMGAPDGMPADHFEFLLRIHDVDGTVRTPWQFIQAAERYDLMRDIDRWVIRNAISTVASLDNDIGFSINISGQSAADPTLLSFIISQFEIHGADPARFWFELTETTAIAHFSNAQKLVKGLSEVGAMTALDDFGSGLSSFGYLKHLPVDILKIDGQFVRDIANNPVDQEIVRSIHAVARSMNIDTVAEFVEDQAAFDLLSEIGIVYAQGYYLGKPMPLHEALHRPEAERRGQADKAA